MRESLEILNIKEDANSFFVVFDLINVGIGVPLKYFIKLQMHVSCYLVTIKYLHEKSILETFNT